MNNPPEWNDIYHIWKNVCHNIFEPLITNPGFIDVQVNYRGKLNFNDETIDWWPSENISKRQVTLEERKHHLDFSACNQLWT